MNALSETARLATLHDYQLLDTPPDDHLDDLTKLVRELCGTPIALVSLVDDDRQWSKSAQGLSTTETPREHAFCAHAIQSDDVMVIEDTLADDRFVDNPMVTGDPHIRFYAGAPLKVSNGHRLGTLCAIDTRPRKLDANQLKALEILRDSVVDHLELQKLGQWPEDVLHVCAWCQKVRSKDNPDIWQTISAFMKHAETVTHGICPDCQSEIARDINNQN